MGAEGKLLQEWELVVLVQLRDKRAQTAQCLSDLLYHPDHEVKEAVWQEVERQEGKRVLLLFDSYDELSDNQRSKLSVYHGVLSKQLLRHATVIGPSCPFATKNLSHQFKDNIEQHVEIVGF